MPAATQNATRPLRNINKIATTNINPPKPFLNNKEMRSSIGALSALGDWQRLCAVQMCQLYFVGV
ncbi:hypothetical protein PN36_21555 [Candidatus Thiomargarita nelsonii]|uniref:Uncharacterized protein n=1 Tax=Candidatus Thiomargarita nelsonii TaxID=1003181 RepID=A0A4E0RQV4_9GAMM|nr:hypothetical protein PN36_21555 [Candidatus Thiomargarita nelsonii]